VKPDRRTQNPKLTPRNSKLEIRNSHFETRDPEPELNKDAPNRHDSGLETDGSVSYLGRSIRIGPAGATSSLPSHFGCRRFPLHRPTLSLTL